VYETYVFGTNYKYQNSTFITLLFVAEVLKYERIIAFSRDVKSVNVSAISS